MSRLELNSASRVVHATRAPHPHHPRLPGLPLEGVLEFVNASRMPRGEAPPKAWGFFFGRSKGLYGASAPAITAGAGGACARARIPAAEDVSEQPPERPLSARRDRRHLSLHAQRWHAPNSTLCSRSCLALSWTRHSPRPHQVPAAALAPFPDHRALHVTASSLPLAPSHPGAPQRHMLRIYPEPCELSSGKTVNAPSYHDDPAKSCKFFNLLQPSVARDD